MIIIFSKSAMLVHNSVFQLRSLILSLSLFSPQIFPQVPFLLTQLATYQYIFQVPIKNDLFN